MMNRVAQIIFNSLARHRSINLPRVGSLRVISVPAKLIGKNMLSLPYYRVEFSQNESLDYVDIINLIQESGDNDLETAKHTYNQWLAEALKADGTLDIEGVGIVQNKFFKPEQELGTLLRPAQDGKLKLQQVSSWRSTIIWLIVALVVGGAIAAAMIMFSGTYKDEETVVSDPITTTVTYMETIAQDTTSAATSTKESVDSTPKSTNEPTQAISSTAASKQSASTSAQSRPPVSGVRYYVIVGVFSNETNADNAIASMRPKIVNAVFEKIYLNNGKIMVAAANCATEAEAEMACDAISKSIPKAWVNKR